MKNRTFFITLIAISLSLACGISSKNATTVIDETVAVSELPTETIAPVAPPATDTPAKTIPTATLDLEATIAAAVAETSTAQHPTDTPVPPTAEALPSIEFTRYDDPAGYFSVNVPNSWEIEADDTSLVTYNADETAMVVIVGVPDDASVVADLIDNGKIFLNSFFADLAPDVTFTDTYVNESAEVATVDFTATDGATNYQGSIFAYLRQGVSYFDLHFAESWLFGSDGFPADEKLKAAWDGMLPSVNFTPPELVADAPTATPTPTTAPSGGTYSLAFARWDGGKHDLYLANTNGGGEKFLLERAAGPSFSPNGTALAFYGEEGVDRQIRDGIDYVISNISNGVLWVNISNFPNDITQVEMGQFTREGSGRYADWSSNGDMIAFDATHGGPDRRVYFLGTDDNQQFNIEILGEQPSWAPNNQQVVYRSGRDNKQGIWISNRDDSNAHPITNEGSDSFPAWSPNGQRIAFHRESGGNVDIYSMNTEGGGVTRLTSAEGPDTLPAWTPDGRIVFRSARSGSWGIYIMNADGSGQRQIIANADPGPDWTFGKMDVH